MDAYHVIISKRELRTYAAEPLPDDVLVKILQAGRRSGSSRNRQPWHFVVVRDRARLRTLAEFGRFARHVPGAAAAVCVVVDGPGSLFDAGRCAQNLMLGAWALGVASCPATMHRNDDAKAFLGVPAGWVLATVVSLGYPHPRGRGPVERTALRILTGRGRRPLRTMVSWERYGASRGEVAGI